MLERKGLFVAAAVLAAGPAHAGGEIFDTTSSSCTTTNCSSVIVGATIKSFPPSAGKWIAEVFASAGQCLRIDVISEFADLETVVVAPNGAVFRDDDGGVGVQPLVKIASTPNNGWYTVSIGRFAGQAETGNFTLAYGRYSAGNPNCAGPTPALGPSIAAPSKPSGEAAAPAPDEPGAK